MASTESKKKSVSSTNLSRTRFYSTTPFNIYKGTEKTYKDLSTEGGNFVWMQLLIDILLNLITSKNGMDEFFRMCHGFDKDEHNGEQIFLFAGVYDSFNPIKWYTKEPFVYRFLNQICRNGDIDKFILMRILIRDINNQLKEEQKKFTEPFITVYRGQAMKLTELEYLQKHIGHFISMNSFLSTSKDRNTALMYAESIDKTDSSLKSVLFEMDCETSRADMKPFADISHLSCFHDEEEILFMLGSVFRVQSVQQNTTNDLWTIKMTLSGKNDYDFDDISQSIGKDLAKNPSLTTLGLLFQRMGDFKRAAQCFQQHSDLLEDDDAITRSACYHNLGNIAEVNGDYDQALFYLDQSLKIRLNLPETKKSIMGSLYNDIGNVYGSQKNYQTAHEYYEKALSLTLECVGENHRQTAMIYGNIGDSYRHQKQYDLALENLNKSWSILNNLEWEDKPVIARSLTSIGMVYCSKCEYRTALFYMEKALNIELQILPTNHIHLAISYNNIGSTYVIIGNYNLAFENFKKAERIFEIALPKGHPKAQAVKKNIATLNSFFNLT